MALGSSASSLGPEISGRAGQGRLEGMPPKREPMVSSGREKAAVAPAASATAISMPGQ